MAESKVDSLSDLGITVSATDINNSLANSKAYTDSEIAEWVGDKKVSEQISAACANVLPAVTTDNNGAFLRVVNGTWSVATIPNAEDGVF